MSHYRCRGEDKEDLTAQVQAKVLNQGFNTLRVLRLVDVERDPGHWRVVVKCSRGHENVFEGTGLP